MFVGWNTWFVIAVLTYSVTLTCTKVLIDTDGGYKNVVVGINPEIPESKIESLIIELEALFKNASRLLHTATRGQTYFKEVAIALPKKYRSKLANRDPRADGIYFKNPDMIVTSKDVFTNPYALQNKGCGRPGLRIHIPDDFLFDNINGKEKTLVQEWAKYRYGVFDESGFEGDDLFPSCYSVPGSDEISITDCTDKGVQYKFKKLTNESKSCSAIPVGETGQVLSSLMSKSSFLKANQFCDNEKYPHNRNVPSKQNALCREESTWNIISQHQDFKLKRISKRNPKEVSFKYIVEPEYRLILAADTSNKMAENDRLDMVRNAFSYFMLYNLPENAVVGVKNLKDKDRNPILVTVQTPSDADQLIDAFPEAYGEGTVCVHCGIQQALQTLKMNSAVAQGEIIIISGTDIEESELKGLENELRNNEATLHVLYFKKRLKEPPLLQTLVRASGGRFFYIPDESSSDNPVSSLILIYEAFRSIYESSSWMNRNHALVDQATFVKEACTRCSISFKSDTSMESFQVILTGPEFSMKPPVIKEKTILSNGNQDFEPGHSSFSYKTKIPAYVFTIKEPKPGIWSLAFERKPNYNKPLVVIVRTSTIRHGEIINMHPWIDVEEFKVTPQRPPITFYSEIKKGNMPVLEVKVSALLYKPDTDEEFSLDLYDSGDGDPDITRNDGMFSRYLTRALGSGYYIITVTAERQASQTQFGNSEQGIKAMKCCGSSFPSKLTYDSSPFKRVATYGSFYLKAAEVGTKFPPRRIVNLWVDKVMLLKGRLLYVFNWTAPGNNYDYETASDYQMRVFNDRVSALTNFDADGIPTINDFQVHGHILEPSIAGSLQSVIIELKNLTNGTYYVAMRTMNSEGKFSDVSNVVEIKHRGTLIPPIQPTSNPFPNSSTETVTQDKPDSSSFRMAIGITCGFLFLFLVIGIFLVVYCKRAHKSRKDKEAMRQRVISRYGGAPPFVGDSAQKTESCDALCENSNVMNISVISPVNSWPANSLLSHYETLQRNKNSDTSETSTVIPKDTSDTASVASSKYSYVNKIDQNSSLYDPIYFPPNERDQVNYPFNPSYAPFNPAYTSSLRRDRENCVFVNRYGSNNINAYDYASERGAPQPRYASLQRYPDDRTENSFISSSTTLYGHEPDRGRRLGTDL